MIAPARAVTRGFLCLIVCAVAALFGCGSPRGVSVSVTPASSLFDRPVRIVVSGLDPDQAVTVALRSADAFGHVWTSRAVFRPDGSGTVDLATTSAMSGSYLGVDPMGLVDALSSSQAVLYYWNVSKPQRFQVSVTQNGSVVATTTFSRALAAAGVTVSAETIAATGFFGQFWRPPPGSPPRPAVLDFGGSEGGLSGELFGAALASAGYPVLDIAYFGEPGLPAQLKDIPLEYFAGALRWLARQPGVRANEMYVSGASRGSEAALLLGAYYPSLVHGVIASTPSDVALCSFPGCGGPAWTLHGKPLPYTRQVDSPAPTDNPAAVIPVQKIRGPVLLDCGTDDQVWVSCAYAQAIQRHLTAAGDRYAHALYQYLGAGHSLNVLVPYEPDEASPNADGDTPQADSDADARLWPEVLSFLADPARQSGTFTAPAAPLPLNSH